MLCQALESFAARYPALASYQDLSAVRRRMVSDRDALDSLCLAYRTESGQLREGAYLLLVVALGDGLLRLAPDAADGGEVLEALWVAAQTPGAPVLLAVARDLIDARRAEKVRAKAVQAAITAGALPTSFRTTAGARVFLSQVLARLTPTEQELAAHVMQGRTAPEIGRLQGRSAEAVTEATRRLRIKVLSFGMGF